MRNRRFSLVLFALLTTILVAAGWMLPFARGGTAPEKLVQTGSTQMPVAFGDDTIGLWSGGALLIVENRFSGAPIFRSFDQNGKQLSEFVLTLGEARLIKVFTFARGSDGAISLEGSGYSGDSRNSPFLALISPDGSQQTIVRTFPFFPDAVSIAPDGTTWVAGHEHMEPGWQPNHGQMLIHRYDRTGKLLGSFLPWSSVPTPAHTGPPTKRSMLAAAKDRVAWYAPVAHLYVEFSLDGAEIRRVETGGQIDTRPAVFTLALCDDASAFLAAPVFNGKHHTGWGMYALDRESGAWNFLARDGKWGELLGCDGTRLATTTDSRTITWLEQKKD